MSDMNTGDQPIDDLQEEQRSVNSAAVSPAGKMSVDLMALRKETDVSLDFGGVKFKNIMEVIDVSKMMAESDCAIPRYLRGNRGACFAITMKALAWRMEPFGVADQSSLQNDRMSWSSQLIHAVIESRAPLAKRLRCSYEGEGDDRVCIVTGYFRGEDEPLVYRSPPLKKMRPAFGDKKDSEGNPIRKGSPLWDKDPDQQSWYYASRNFARRYCPDIILGVYTSEELEEYADREPRDVTEQANALHQRLIQAPKNNEGFHATVVEDALREGEIEPPAQPPKKRGRPPKQPIVSEEQEQPQPEPQSAAPPAARPANAPTTTAEYRDHLSAWLPRIDNADDVRAHWTAEFKMRRLCQISADDAKLFLALVNARCAQLDGGK